MEKNGMKRLRLPPFDRSMCANLFDVNEPTWSTQALLSGMASKRTSAHTQKEFTKKEKQEPKKKHAKYKQHAHSFLLLNIVGALVFGQSFAFRCAVILFFSSSSAVCVLFDLRHTTHFQLKWPFAKYSCCSRSTYLGAQTMCMDLDVHISLCVWPKFYYAKSFLVSMVWWWLWSWWWSFTPFERTLFQI